MVNSIYTHKEIFLREIISNASDAIDKLCYLSLTDSNVGMNRSDFKITIKIDKEARTLTISDNGIGMTEEELEENLGVIAKSGSRAFKTKLEEGKTEGADIDIIGQFGVGFYSAFMVADRIIVITRAYGSDQAYRWTSEGEDGYTIEETEKASVGTDIILEIKQDIGEEHFSDYLEVYQLRSLIKKYSDYVRYPIRMDVPKSRPVETEENGEKKTTYESYTEEETINSMVPIWQRTRAEATDEDCTAFYKENFFDMEDPARIIRVNAEGSVSYKALLFVPTKAPYGYYTKEFEKGLRLYTSGVMIMDRCEDLLPDHFRFVKGVVDSEDLSLNISRELLQHDRQLKVIAHALERKIKTELLSMKTEDAEKYNQFWHEFGLQIKYGIVSDYGTHRELLEDLLIFHSAKENKLISLDDYVNAMPEDQKYIYYACGESAERVAKLPQAERILDQGYDMLCLTDEVDEFVMNALAKFKEKEFRSASSDDLGLETEEQKKIAEDREKEAKDLLDFVKDSLGGKVANVKLSKNLKSHPVFLSTEGPVTLEMEKYFASIPGDNKPKAERVLELNADHPVYATINSLWNENKEKAAKYSEILYTQALLIAGMPIEDPEKYTELVCELMTK